MDVLERFFQIAERQPDHVAVQTATGSTTYAALARMVRQFAGAFSTQSSPRVVVAFDQGPYAYAAMFGTMLAGGIYAPVSVSAPSEKIASICRSFQPTIVAGSRAKVDELRSLAPQAHFVEHRDVEACEPLWGGGDRNRVAYVIFTSGSTGQPKGVVVSHVALSHYIDWVVASQLFAPSDRVSQYSNIAFDVSVLDIFGPLCVGATIFPFTSRGERLMPADAVMKYAITVWISVPSVISLMMRARQLTAKHLATVRRLFFAGEPLLDTHVRGIFAARPDAEIWNAYGPTETTVTMTYLKLRAGAYEHLIRSSVALGDPIPGMEVRLVGGESDDSGEIVIAGPQVADGYWDATEQTERVFRTIEIDGHRKRVYFSGDWGFMSEGQLYFQHRVDHQVKINGHRIELNEVAAAIRGLGCQEVVVLKVGNELAALIETKSSASDRLISSLHLQLQLKLDRHAIPSHLLAVGEFPRNQNDKIDLKALALIAERAVRSSR